MSTIHLVFDNLAAAISGLAAAGFKATPAPDGTPVLPTTLFTPARVDIIVEGGGSGIMSVPDPSGATVDDPGGMKLPAMKALPGFRLSVTGEGLPEFGDAVSPEGGGDVLAPPPVEPVVPEKVSQTQFMRAAARVGLVTAEEAEAYLSVGKLPGLVTSAFDAIPDDAARADARLKAIGATEFFRGDDLFALLIGSGAATAAQVDALFQLAGSLA